MSKENKKGRKLYLSNEWVTTIFIYYLLIFIIGLLLSFSGLTSGIFGVITEDILIRSLEGSAGMALTGSSIFYIRKLYKLCFGEKLDSNVESHVYLERLGTVVYFLARPLFAIGFSFLIVIGIRSGFMLAAAQPIVLKEGFVFITMFFSFFVGFLSGRFIENLERRGDYYLNKIGEETNG